MRVVHNPARPNHCVYESALYITGLKISTKLIKAVRKEVARKILQTYMHNDSYEGINMRSAIHAYSGIVKNCVRSTMSSLWASPLEVAILSHLLQVRLVLQTSKGFLSFGDAFVDNKMIMVVRNKHYHAIKRHQQRAVKFVDHYIGERATGRGAARGAAKQKAKSKSSSTATACSLEAT